MTDIYDLTIVGGGPAGMYASFYAGMREMRTKLIEAKHELGGFMRMYPEKMIWDVGGVNPIRCEQLILDLERQARTFDPTIVFGQEIRGLQRREDGVLMLTSDTGELHLTRTLLMCAGRGITQIQKLAVEGADRYELANLHYTITDLEHFRGKKVLVTGGGNSAVDWAVELADYASHVTVVHRRREFDALERQVTRMYASAEVRTPFNVSRLIGEGDRIHAVELSDAETGAEMRIEADEILVNHGFSRNYGHLLEWGLERQDYGVTVDNSMATSIPGVFGAGDFVTFGTKVRLIAGAFNDAVLAVNHAKLYLDPNASKMAGVSSHHDRFRELNRALAASKPL
ncbi:NAD(P)/FAD-dependent oxidoreductase [Saccharibacillus brassicae]|uniref:Ferredoxin--NADP reductase n=2 Tax=Saccharibacillus brassicae TaxID=2583377 RepID=A0A4Y6UUN7_SACBS|nr:NAD(P)/FAD-dependent oxidoreductase [Saccharibacillus brassicae]QDH21412.1 NAD(P)/FAD-dependent oxidoreductase [Saccharibacillus brassicae]